MKWIEEGRGIVPTDFNITLEKLSLDSDLTAAIGRLLESKRSGNELDQGQKIPVISNFIEGELGRWENALIPKKTAHPHDDQLDEFFRESIREVW